MPDERLTALAKYLDSYPKAAVPDHNSPAVFIQEVKHPGVKSQYVLLDYDLLGVLVKSPNSQKTTFIRWQSIVELSPD